MSGESVQSLFAMGIFLAMILVSGRILLRRRRVRPLQLLDEDLRKARQRREVVLDPDRYIHLSVEMIREYAEHQGLRHVRTTTHKQRGDPRVQVYLAPIGSAPEERPDDGG